MDGILSTTVAPAPDVDPALQTTCEGYGRAVAEALGHVGVLCLELFQTDRGVLANELTHARPENAIAILCPRASGGFVVSVRVPPSRLISADAFCREFETGGGRKLAAGIDCLQDGNVASFVQRFEARHHFRRRVGRRCEEAVSRWLARAGE